jgi:hypothetical protein
VGLGRSSSLTLVAVASLVLDGLLLAGGSLSLTVPVAAEDAAHYEVRRAAGVPGLARDATGAAISPSAVVLHTHPTSTGVLRAIVARSIVGRIDLTAGGPSFLGDLHISDSVIDDAGDPTVVLRAHDLDVARSTVLGSTAARALEATDTFFVDRVTVERTQRGCVRYSFVPMGSKVPRTHRCQPALALAAPGADAPAIIARLRPAFTTTRYGDGAYVQLASSCPPELRTGGSEGNEMGAHFHLHQPQREANLRQGLDEYLRFGLDASLVFVT